MIYEYHLLNGSHLAHSKHHSVAVFQKRYDNINVTVVEFYLFAEIDRKDNSQRKLVKRKPKFSKLLIYGDSQADRLYRSLKNTSVCKNLFESCAVRKMWVYGFTGETVKWDKLDFDYRRIVVDVRKNLEDSSMDEKSVMLLNLGLHYVDSTNFTNYQKLIKGIIQLLNEKTKTKNGKETLKYPARIIWKTSTAISKEKDTDSQLYSDRRRFFNLPVSNNIFIHLCVKSFLAGQRPALIGDTIFTIPK